MRMVEAMDAGPILHAIHEPILPDETGSELSLRLSELAAEALVEALTLLDGGEARPVEQDHTKATYAPKIDRTVARVDWSRPAADVARHVRAMDAVPGAWSELEGHPIKVFRPHVVEARERGAAGTILGADGAQGVVVAAGQGAVALEEIQPSGKRRMSAGDWIHGRGVRAGQRFV
jgi:methionyl-tRNA formyltransferase